MSTVAVCRGMLLASLRDGGVTVLNQEGAVLQRWDMSEAGEPLAIAVSENEVFVALWFRIDVFRLDGSRLRTWGRQGVRHGEFDGARDLAVRRGQAYVADVYNDRIQVFTACGHFLLTFPVFRPVGVDSTAEFVFVITGSSLLCTFDLAGTALQSTPLWPTCLLRALVISEEGVCFALRFSDPCGFVCVEPNGGVVLLQGGSNFLGFALWRDEALLISSGPFVTRIKRACPRYGRNTTVQSTCSDA